MRGNRMAHTLTAFCSLVDTRTLVFRPGLSKGVERDQ